MHGIGLAHFLSGGWLIGAADEDLLFVIGLEMHLSAHHELAYGVAAIAAYAVIADAAPVQACGPI